MGEEYCLGSWSDSRFDQLSVNIVGSDHAVNEYWHEPALDYRVDSRRESGGDGNDFVSWFEGPLSELGR